MAERAGLRAQQQSRRATITPTAAVSVSRSSARQFRTWLIAWLVSRPEVSIRLIP
jgi:hypothetical protein